MKSATVETLQRINREFYREFAGHFSTSRQYAWVGFEKIAKRIRPTERFLDVGCGNGRLGGYLLENEAVSEYVGVDFSTELLAEAAVVEGATFHERNLLDEEPFAGLGKFDAIASIAVFHHIPGEANRIRLLQRMTDALLPGGTMIVTTFQFMTSERTRRKVVDWQQAAVDERELESADYLLDWNAGGYGLRYLNHIDEPALRKLISQTDLQLLELFRSDGKEGNLNLYAVLTH